MTFLFRCLFLAALLLPALPAVAQDDLSPQVKQAEAYLDGLSTLKARFTQTSPDGAQATGTFYLSRPGRLRFEYDPPSKDFIVADGIFIYFYDGQMGEQSNTRISNSLADFFLRQNLTLTGDVRVTGTARAGDLFLVTVAQASDPGAGSLTLGLSQKPEMALRKWSVRDAQGMVTDIELSEIETGLPLKRSLFYYHDPKRRAPQYN